jgi:hypothetical protein
MKAGRRLKRGAESEGLRARRFHHEAHEGHEGKQEFM